MVVGPSISTLIAEIFLASETPACDQSRAIPGRRKSKGHRERKGFIDLIEPRVAFHGFKPCPLSSKGKIKSSRWSISLFGQNQLDRLVVFVIAAGWCGSSRSPSSLVIVAGGHNRNKYSKISDFSPGVFVCNALRRSSRFAFSSSCLFTSSGESFFDFFWSYKIFYFYIFLYITI